MITYIIKVILCSGVFLLAYKLLLEKEKMHLFNRFYLLFSLLLSFTIPFITLASAASFLPVIENNLITTYHLQDNPVTSSPAVEQNKISLFSILVIIYITISIILAIRFILNLRKIISKVLTHQILTYKKAKIVLIPESILPHSFLNYLFLHKKEYQNIENEILLHEYAHIQQKHSFDILFLEVVQTLFWFNPFLAFYRKDIQLNHEYLADEAVINTTQDISSYQILLVSKIAKVNTGNFTSHFNYSIAKKRLLMMTKTKSPVSSLCRQLFILPVLALSVFAFSTKTFAQDSLPVSKTKQHAAPSTQEGVTQELLNEYQQIVSKSLNEKGMPVVNKLSAAERNRLETIYLSMSRSQQEKQIVLFIPAPPPLPKIVPGQSQLESWKNAKIYGLWIDGKRVSNAVLAKYKTTDFSQVFVSKLGKNTVNYGKHYYQVDLMTNEHYEAYYKQRTESKKKYYIGARIGKNGGIVAE